LAAQSRALLGQGKSVRSIVRNPEKAQDWLERGVELARADYGDAVALQAAFTGVEGGFVMIPPYFAPAPGFPEARAIVSALRESLSAARPPKLVYLSSIGAQHDSGLGLITQLHILEQELSSLPIPSAFLRAAWFMENSLWDIASARDRGEILSFLQPLDRKVPMVATEDIGRIAAETLLGSWADNRYIEIEGSQRYSPSNLALVLSNLLHHPVQARLVPRAQWDSVFQSQGTAPDRTAPRIEMLDGFNSGWIEFQRQGTEHVFGRLTLTDALGPLVDSISLGRLHKMGNRPTCDWRNPETSSVDVRCPEVSSGVKQQADFPVLVGGQRRRCV
jgi:NAD(P)H dehydrogenase (quinone)